MEAPYRNNEILTSILEICRTETKLCIASNITLEHEFIVSKEIQEWKKRNFQIFINNQLYLSYMRNKKPDV